MTGLLREPISEDQARLIRVIFEPFDVSGEWPIWQYVGLTFDARYGLDAADVLASLPSIGGHGSHRYELTWHQNAHMQPSPETQIALTVAGLRYLANAVPLLGSFLTMIRYLADQQRTLIPSPSAVVVANVESAAIADEVLSASIRGAAAPPVDATIRKLRQMLGHEPFLYSVVHQPAPAVEQWTVRVPAVLRTYRDVATIDDYLDRVIEQVAPSEPASVPMSFGALDIPYAIGYLDAVWKSRTGSNLFVNLDPASTARLTQPCTNEGDFNSLMSALADVLGQCVTPGRTVPSQRGALEALRDYLTSQLETESADRLSGAVGMLIQFRKIRVSTQHSDARHRAVTAFQEIGLPFPPVSWDQAWTYIAALAKGALDVLREEIHAGLPAPGA